MLVLLVSQVVESDEPGSGGLGVGGPVQQFQEHWTELHFRELDHQSCEGLEAPVLDLLHITH